MNYDNSKVRRQDRLLDVQRAEELLQTCEYGILSMTDTDGLPYAVPINFVWNKENSIYVHCAMEGKKINALMKNPNVSFCIIGRVNLLPNKFTTEYESVIMQGKAELNITDEEKTAAIELLLQKLSPNDIVIGRKYAEKSFKRTKIIRIDFSLWSGKTKKVM
ncbi:MAG: pyridoxamine 5'-phosphate oxidase family protein [Bacteroidales bacterium]|nr:pyridoxamine 5'-phosphate oxidase family protein [Bacteroidales bacterium]